MNKDYNGIWQNCLQSIQEEVNAQSFKTWFEPIKPVKLEGLVLTIQVPNRFFYEWLEEHYVEILKKTIQHELGAGAKLEYMVPRKVSGSESTNNPNQVTFSKDLEKHYGQAPIRTEQIKNPFVIPGIQKVKVDSQLNPDYIFDNFIEGDCNRLARSAGWAIAKKPGAAFNPLMIFGSVGLGKTHLAHAVGNEVKKNFPDKTVLYVSAERFTNQFIDSLKNNATNDFVNFYQLIDVLIVDDIQFLSNKLKTQDIFFHLFNHLHQSGKQVILTCDRPPKELEGIEDRLVSRFKWGLSADIQLPSLETRLAIIQQKLEQDGIEIPHHVAEYLSYNVRTNIRELEGILISLIAQSALNQRDIDIDLAKEVIAKFITEVSDEIGADFITKVVAEYYKIPTQQLKEKTRTKLVVIARQLSMYLVKTLCGKSLSEIGRAFGGRDHTTVLHACRSVEEMLQTDEAFKVVVQDIKGKIKSMGNN